MQKTIGPVEMVQVDPRVAEMQARAHAAMSGDLSDGWFQASLSMPNQDKGKLSRDMRQWMDSTGSSNQTRPVARPGTAVQGSMDDRELLAKTLMAEAGAEGYEGLLAAGAVIANRVNNPKGTYGTGLRGVIMKPGQFSAWNSVTGYAKGKGGLNMDRISPSEAAYRAADAIMQGQYQDPTGGATHYYNPDYASPVWGQTAEEPWQKIGNHVFGWGDR